MDHFVAFNDPEHMKVYFKEHLPAFSQNNDLSIQDCRVLNARFKPHKKQKKRSFSPCYELKILDHRHNTVGTLILYCKAYAESRSTEVFQSVDKGALVAPPFGDPLIHIPEYDLLVWTFPNDPQLPHLAHALDAQRVKPLLPATPISPDFLMPHDIIEIKSEVVNYRPEFRCMTKFTVRGGHPHHPQTVTIYGKTYRPNVGQVIFHRMEYLWKKFLENPDNPRVPQPLGFTEEIHTMWLWSALGLPLSQVISTSNFSSYLQSVIKALFRLQQYEIPNLSPQTIERCVEEAKEKLSKLRMVIPQLTPTFDRFEVRLETFAPDTFSNPCLPVHGDFHINQILANNGQVTILDFDEMGLGDPLKDLAQFIVDLHFRGLDPALVQLMCLHLYHEYRKYSSDDLSATRLNWHLQIQFLNKAYRYFLQHRPGCAKTVNRIFQMAELPILGEDSK